MKSVILNSYQELIERAGRYDNYELPKAEDLLRYMGFLVNIQYNAQSPIFYVVDYTKNRYLYVDPSYEAILGYDHHYLIEKGPLYFVSLWHKNDYKIFIERIFPESMRFLKSRSPEEYLDFSISYNYRVQAYSGDFRTFLQRKTYYIASADGTPLGAVGFAIDITHFKEDTRIIHTIEKIDRNFNTLSPQPLYKTIYYPDKEFDVLSKRELEILQYISEGLSSKQIASTLFVSVNTINNHRKNMLEKTNTNNASELLRYAINKGLL